MLRETKKDRYYGFNKENKLLFLTDMIPSKFLFNSSWKYEIMLQFTDFSLDAQKMWLHEDVAKYSEFPEIFLKIS